MKMKWMHIMLWAFFILCSNSLHAQWERTDGLKGDTYSSLAVFHDSIFAVEGNSDYILFVSGNFGQSWTKDTINSVRNIMFFGSKAFAIVNGRFCISDNETRSWKMIDSSLMYSHNFYYPEVYTVHNNIIYLSVASNELYKTSDFGTHWENISPPFSISNLMADDTRLYAIKYSAGISQFINNNWQDIPMPTSRAIATMAKLDTILLFSEGEVIYMKYDHSAIYDTLSQNFISAGDTVMHITRIITEGNKIFVSVWGGGIYCTENMGVSWQCLTDNIVNNHIDLFIVKDGDIFVSFYDLGIYYTLDNGQSWHATKLESHITPNSFGKISGQVFCGGNAGQIYQLINNEWLPSQMKSTLFFDAKVNDYYLYNGNYYIATQCGVIISRDNGRSWDNYYNGLYFLSNFSPSYSLFTCRQLLYVTNWKGAYYLDEQNNRWIRDNNFPFDTHNDQIDNIHKVAIYDSILCDVTMHGLFYSSDNGRTWSRSLSHYMDSVLIYDYNLKIKVTDDHIFYLSADHNRLFKSEDNGITWTKINNGINDSVEVLNIACSGTVVFAGTDRGVYMTENKGQSWHFVNDGLGPDKYIYSLNSFDDYIYAGIYWGQVFRRPLNTFITKTITGTVFFDSNDNSIQDNQEEPLNNVIVGMEPGGYYTNTDQNGFYSIQGDIFSDSVFIPYHSNYLHSNPSHYYVYVNDSNKNFGVYIAPGVNDLRISLTRRSFLRPGRETCVRISYLNIGSTILNPIITYMFDSLISFNYCSITPSIINSNTLKWNLPAIQPFQAGNIDVYFLAETPLINLQNYITMAEVLPIVGDSTPANNFDTLIEPVNLAVDPNDKEVSPKGNITPGQVAAGQELVYTIRFQNVGNDTAFTIKIIDTLSYKLNIPSFRVLSASHPYSYQISGKGVVTFKFLNILLPDSNHNEMLSHGFVKFAVNVKKDLQLNDTVKNCADIYFDYNDPVKTNTTLTIVKEKQINPVIKLPEDELLVYPNPANGNLNIYFDNPDNSTGQLYVYNSLGSKICCMQVSGSSLKFNTSNLSQGIYHIEVILPDRKLTSKFIVP